MQFLYYTKRLMKMPILEYKLLLWGFLLSCWYGITLIIVPSRQLAQFFTISSPEISQLNDSDYAKIKLIEIILNRLQIICPWENNCLITSMITRKLLQYFDIKGIIRFSVKKDGHSIHSAHAWVSINETIHLYKIQNYIDLSI